LRSNPTEAEQRLWSILRNKRLADYKFKRQAVIDHYIVDFINFEHRLIIEADGSQHAESAYDLRRDAYLKSQNFTMLRFWNNDVLARTDAVVEAIWNALQSPLPSAALRLPPSPARGEGPGPSSSPLAGEDSEACSRSGLVQLGEGCQNSRHSKSETGATHV
jgi:very-short-patch-repair endonuclease